MAKNVYITVSEAVASVNGMTGQINIDKGSIGLGNVDNTSDLNKPISTATQTAISTKSTIHNVADEAEMLALSSSVVKNGDIVRVEGQAEVLQVDRIDFSDLLSEGDVYTDVAYDQHNINIIFYWDSYSAGGYSGTINDILLDLQSQLGNYAVNASISGDSLILEFTDSMSHSPVHEYGNQGAVGITAIMSNIQPYTPATPVKYYLVTDSTNLNSLNGYLELKEWVSLDESGNFVLIQDQTLNTDTSNYAFTIDTTGSATLNLIANANQYGNTDFSMTEKATGNRWALGVYDNTQGGDRNGKFGFNSTGVGDAFELHKNLNAFFNGNLAVGLSPTVTPDAKLFLISTGNIFKGGYNTSNYFTINVSSTGLVTFDAVGTGARFRFNDVLSQPQATKAGNSTGTAGDIAWDANNIYVCTATNVWKKVALTAI